MCSGMMAKKLFTRYHKVNRDRIHRVLTRNVKYNNHVSEFTNYSTTPTDSAVCYYNIVFTHMPSSECTNLIVILFSTIYQKY